MAFSFGRRLASFISDHTPKTFKSSLGPLDPPSVVDPISEVPAGAWPHDGRQERSDIDFGAQKNPAPRSSFEQYWNRPLKNGRTRAQALYDIGSILRDRDDSVMAVTPDPIQPPSALPSRGGGVGGVGGTGSRRTGRWTA